MFYNPKNYTTLNNLHHFMFYSTTKFAKQSCFPLFTNTLGESNIIIVGLWSARVAFDPPASIYFIFSNFPRSRNINAPHEIFVGISLIFKINGIYTLFHELFSTFLSNNMFPGT